MRAFIYRLVEVSEDDSDKIAYFYDIGMMITIFASIIPLAFKETYPVFAVIDKVTVTIFIIDYILRLITADYKLKRHFKSFIIYPFTPMALIDLLSILPSISIVSNSFRLFKLVRLLRTFKVFRLLRVVRYSKNIQLFMRAFDKQRELLGIVLGISVMYVLVCALVILNVEPESFNNFFDALYWAVVSLTTVGYGDLYPVTVLGRAITMISSFAGIAIVALPAGVITSGLVDVINEMKEEEKTKEKDKE